MKEGIPVGSASDNSDHITGNLSSETSVCSADPDTIPHRPLPSGGLMGSLPSTAEEISVIGTSTAGQRSAVLVLDCDNTIRSTFETAVNQSAVLNHASTAQECLSRLRIQHFDAVILDGNVAGKDGLQLIDEIRELNSIAAIIVVTSDNDGQQAIEAMQKGAYDFISKPLDVARMRTLMHRLFEQQKIATEPVAIEASTLRNAPHGNSFLGSSPAMLEVFKRIGRVANHSVPVLIRGESGTGKELAAFAIHQASGRSAGPFVAINCAAVPDHLLEAELFGHEKGAFTGAEQQRVGKFELAAEGTLFLDEIGDMPLPMQAKMLRVLQDLRFQRVGGNTEIRANVRVLAATHCGLEKMVAEGRFREDLLFRLNGMTITLPPLRDRMSDLGNLVQHFLNEAKHEFQCENLTGISPAAISVLADHPWPGNVRELRDVVRRAVVETSLPVISAETTLAVLSPESETKLRPPGNSPGIGEVQSVVRRAIDSNPGRVYAEVIEYTERQMFVQVLEECNGNRTKAAAMLGIARTKLRERMTQFGIKVKGTTGKKS